jgi:protein gp37
VTVGDVAGIRRADILRGIPAAVRFLSVEPLLEDIPEPDLAGVHWIIVGGELGAGCRPMDLAWARSLSDATHRAGAAFFMKQIGGFPRKRDKLEHFPADLRIREFPVPRVAQGVVER